MDESGMDMACTSRRQWLEALQYYTSNQAARKHAAQRGMAFVAEWHSEKHTLELWDHVLGSVLSGEAANPRQPIDSFSQVSTSPTGAHS
jgi:hypothetical protein